MNIQINLNGQTRSFAVEPGETLMAAKPANAARARCWWTAS